MSRMARKTLLFITVLSLVSLETVMGSPTSGTSQVTAVKLEDLSEDPTVPSSSSGRDVTSSSTRVQRDSGDEDQAVPVDTLAVINMLNTLIGNFTLLDNSQKEMNKLQIYIDIITLLKSILAQKKLKQEDSDSSSVTYEYIPSTRFRRDSGDEDQAVPVDTLAVINMLNTLIGNFTLLDNSQKEMNELQIYIDIITLLKSILAWKKLEQEDSLPLDSSSVTYEYIPSTRFRRASGVEHQAVAEKSSKNYLRAFDDFPFFELNKNNLSLVQILIDSLKLWKDIALDKLSENEDELPE